jgi:steroid delta-isomerase-like uncharacterized protein
MSVEGNKNLVRDYVKTWNAGDLQGLSNFWSRDMRHHTRTQAQSFSEVQGVVSTFMEAFPDLQFEIDDIIAEDDRVMTRMTARATHTGSYMGVPPTGKKIDCTIMGVARISDGKIVEHWGITDELLMLHQIGVLQESHLAGMT